MRAPDNFTFFSLVLLTLATARPAPRIESATESAILAHRAGARGPGRDVRVRLADPRIVVRRPS